MEDIIKTILAVVRAQHTATEGTEEKPFDMDDIVDMALGVMGRPDEPEETQSMTETIQQMVESMAPDLFPPKTFEQMDDEERAASVTNMLENRLRNGFAARTDFSVQPEETQTSAVSSAVEVDSQADQQSASQPVSAYPDNDPAAYGSDDGMPAALNPEETAQLNDLIYKNLMEMMGAQPPRVEFPFDRSQIRYGREKTITEQLQEEQQEKERQSDAAASPRPAKMSAADLAQQLLSQEEPSQVSAWDLAQKAVNKDEEAHKKEPYIPKPVEEPKPMSASQLAAEAIAKAQEEDKMKMEIEKQAEALMAEAAKRGQDPMKFALHQQEILRYMEKNSDELVSFEDYEDLSPEEKLEVERKIYIEKQIAEGVNPDEVDTEVPAEYIPPELSAESEPVSGEEAGTPAGGEKPVLSEEMLRMLSQEVVSEHSDMILAENADEDIEGLQQTIFENLKQMMSQSGEPVAQEDVGDLIEQAIAANRENQLGVPQSEAEKQEDGQDSEVSAPKDGTAIQEEEKQETEETVSLKGISAVELARAAQEASRSKAEKPERETRSAAEIAREAQEKAKAARQQEQDAEKTEDTSDSSIDALVESLESDFDDLDLEAEEIDADQAEIETSDTDQAEPEASDTEETEPETSDEEDSFGTEPEEEDMAEASEQPQDEEEEEEYIDPNERVLGDHTQAEVDEALDNLGTLGLEGEVYERAKRMLLLELAGSEAELEAWLKEQEKKKTAGRSSSRKEEEIGDISELDEDELERELELAMDEDFLDEEFLEEETPEEETSDEEASKEETPEEEGTDDDLTEDEIPDEELSEELPYEDGEDDGEADNETLAFGDVIEVETVGAEPEPVSSSKESRAGTSEKTSRKKKVFRRKDKAAARESSVKFSEKQEDKEAEAKSYQVSTRKPFVLKNSASFMDQFEDFIVDTQENRRLSTGFRKLDAMLRYGLHKGSYFIDAQPQYLKNGFMQQIADRAAEAGIDVLYISTELSRYDLMVETISRLSYEIHQGDPDKAVSAMAIMTGEDGADLASLKDELNWYRGRISEHLFILDQEAVSEYADSSEDASAGDILTELISSIVREGAHKPVVFIDNIENILSTEDSEDMKPLMEGMSRLAKELGIPILMSYGYAQAESEEELYPEEKEYHESLGNMCDVYMELTYADMITEDSVPVTSEDIREMVEDGESLPINVILHKNRRPMKASLQIQGTPRYHFFEE